MVNFYQTDSCRGIGSARVSYVARSKYDMVINIARRHCSSRPDLCCENRKLTVQSSHADVPPPTRSLIQPGSRVTVTLHALVSPCPVTPEGWSATVTLARGLDAGSVDNTSSVIVVPSRSPGSREGPPNETTAPLLVSVASAPPGPYLQLLSYHSRFAALLC